MLGIVLNLATLGYVKYANFFVDNLNAAAVLNLELVDAYRDRVDRLNFIDYVLFVTFFPQLIAGPIVQHSGEVMRQFRDPRLVSMRAVALGVTIFTIGLAKKVLLAAMQPCRDTLPEIPGLKVHMSETERAAPWLEIEAALRTFENADGIVFPQTYLMAVGTK